MAAPIASGIDTTGRGVGVVDVHMKTVAASTHVMMPAVLCPSRQRKVPVRTPLTVLVATLVALLTTLSASTAAAPPRAWNGQPCTIVGTPGADRLFGTAGDDVICGRGGPDRIYGGRGNDTIDGGSGADVLYGGAGADRIFGGDGRDRIHGDGNDDRLFGQRGSDVVRGGWGGDYVHGGPGNDRLHGDRDEDGLIGGVGDDTLAGGRGNDRLIGGPGRDTCDFEDFGPDGERRSSCTFDFAPPRIRWVDPVAWQIDVSESDGAFTIHARFADDTTFSPLGYPPSVRLYTDSVELESEFYDDAPPQSHRDDVWEAWIPVPQGFPDTKLNIEIRVRDAAGKVTRFQRDDYLRVVNNNPDT
ncbi:calcium-binding protein [Nocardioides speluncae]|uniref:calcium-binding protein n=1 Tax=Nocardioides speluncae TaxID=2670337 RepID=UPI000D69BECA|nr:calcium-binding protein [Nocardioides speluncae]